MKSVEEGMMKNNKKNYIAQCSKLKFGSIEWAVMEEIASTI